MISATHPKLSVITPSYNQAAYLEKTILSVISQDYPNLEFIIIDGGSTDGSLDIIKKYSNHLTYWESIPDGGQANAINKGIKKATGEWVCWQNSDDIFYTGAFKIFSDAIKRDTKVDFLICDINIIDANDRVIKQQRYVRPSYRSILSEGMLLTNQAAYWKRSLHNRIGYMDENLDCAFDYDWFLRVLKNNLKSKHIPVITGALRYHQLTKTNLNKIKFAMEMKIVAKKNRSRNFPRIFYYIRRIILLIANGNTEYILIGIARRFNYLKSNLD